MFSRHESGFRSLAVRPKHPAFNQMHAVRAEQGLSEVEGPYRSTCARIGHSCAASTSLSCACRRVQ
ncbi:hypothetical protein SJA_C1-35160 [Sphingobium indicum UT26S]|uniref:Uncharacterized protein n=1 Tax=Sphingobium indicum (strain DSM 16413 / CCM 7287 / MTCC 6362 / UT26 / NBRC 101211 / UT26S) TaxID=452662 RepID=D4Z6W8_SPHIU|nr:hypothetical protein SJA_C1-35160 [Sphingobium indicum UT26S]